MTDVNWTVKCRKLNVMVPLGFGREQNGNTSAEIEKSQVPWLLFSIISQFLDQSKYVLIINAVSIIVIGNGIALVVSFVSKFRQKKKCT